MNPISDDDLVLYHYRDGLDATRTAEIEAALAASGALRERYGAVERAIAHFSEEEPPSDPDLSARLWRRLAPQLEDAGLFTKKSTTFERLRTLFAQPTLRMAFAGAAILIVAIGLGFLVGRQTVTVAPLSASNDANAAAARVLEAYVAANLRATEGVLLTASNSGDVSLLEGNRELAQSLVESNRLYALAAARAGDARLANFLRQLEPVLLSLANQPGSATIQSSEDLRRFLDTTDLLFQVRATQAHLARTGEQRPDNGDSRI